MIVAMIDPTEGMKFSMKVITATGPAKGTPAEVKIPQTQAAVAALTAVFTTR